MTHADLHAIGSKPRGWSVVEAEAVIGQVLVGVRRACTWNCERWRWFAVPILYIDKGQVSARPVHARARGHAPSYEEAMRLAQSAAEAIERERIDHERREAKRGLHRGGASVRKKP